MSFLQFYDRFSVVRIYDPTYDRLSFYDTSKACK